MTKWRKGFLVEIVRSFYRFVENSARFLLKIELLFTMFPNFGREVALKDPAF